MSAEDHLETISRVKRTGQLPLFSFYTLLRSAGEAVLRCRHLLLAPDAKTRFSRSLNERLDNLIEMRKLDPDVPDAEFQRRLAELKKRALPSGIRPKFGQRGRLSRGSASRLRV